MGDFNFCSRWKEENDNIRADYIDLWAHLQGDNPGYTEDTKINEMLHSRRRDDKQVRFDRIILRDKTKQWTPESIDIIGTTQIMGEPCVWISDHFGLMGVIERRWKGDGKEKKDLCQTV